METSSLDAMLSSLDVESFDFTSTDVSDSDSYFDRKNKGNSPISDENLPNNERSGTDGVVVQDRRSNLRNVMLDPQQFYSGISQKKDPESKTFASKDKTNKRNYHTGPILHEVTNHHMVTRSKKVSTSQEAYCPLAEQVHKFHRTTPKRYHVPSKREEVKFPSNTVNSCHLTIPVTPKLISRTRKRNVKIVSQKEKEEKELEELKELQFKAHPMNPDIFKEQQILKPILKKTTEIVPFNLHVQTKKPPVEEEKFEFHAQPVPKSIYIKPEDTRPLPKTTIPETPSFVRRITRKRAADSDSSAHSSCNSTCAGVIQKKDPQPFSFVQRDQERLRMKEELIQKKIQEEEALLREESIFHAYPLPDLNKPAFVPKREHKTTEPKPFKFLADPPPKKRKTEDDEVPHFKARPIPPAVFNPFKVVTDCEKKITEMEDFILHTDLRAKERDLYDQGRLMRLNQLMEERAMVARQRELLEEQELKELRQATVHKAQPIKHFPPLEIKKSVVPLTTPISPNLMTKHVK